MAFKMKGSPYPNKKYSIEKSDIQGKGVFASKNLKKGEFIGAVITNAGKDPRTKGNQTDIRKKLNHQSSDNSIMKKEDGDFNLYSKEDVKSGEELTTNYKNLPWWVNKDTAGFKEK